MDDKVMSQDDSFVRQQALLEGSRKIHEEQYERSLRDSFAIAALGGFCSHMDKIEAKDGVGDIVARVCYGFADSMLEARKPKEDGRE